MSTISLATIILLPIQLLILASLFTPHIFGLRLFATSHRLSSLRLQKRADAFKPHIYTPFSLLLHPDSEIGITRQDLEAIKAMKSARHSALFGPLACVPGLMAIPMLLYITINRQETTHSSTTITVLTSIATLVLLLAHYANASTVHHYFALVEDEEKLLFGKEIKTARQELLHSYGLKRVYLIILFALCRIRSQGIESERTSRYHMRQGEIEVEEVSRMPTQGSTDV
jgi:hypothetical protein